MTRKFEYRAFAIEGFAHGGGGARMTAWRTRFDEAEKDLVELKKGYHYGDSVFGIECRRVEA